MLLLSPGMPTGTEGRDLGQLHEAKNTSAAMDALVRWSRRVRSADEAAEAVTEAFASFSGRRPRPVHVEIPIDVLEQTWAGDAAGRPPAAPRRTRTRTPCARAAELLAAADRPLIIAGGGAVDAPAELTALAEALGAPVATTVNGKGVARRDAPALGRRRRCGCARCSRPPRTATRCCWSAPSWATPTCGRAGSAAAAVIRIDIDPAQLHKNCPADVALLGDAGTVRGRAGRAGTRRSTHEPPPRRGRRARGGATAAALRDGLPRRGAAPTPARTPRSTPRSARALPAEAVLCRGQLAGHLLRLGALLRRARPRGGSATPPASPPSATGCRPGWVPSLARPGRPVAVLLGDGALMFSRARSWSRWSSSGCRCRLSSSTTAATRRSATSRQARDIPPDRRRAAHPRPGRRWPWPWARTACAPPTSAALAATLIDRRPDGRPPDPAPPRPPLTRSATS